MNSGLGVVLKLVGAFVALGAVLSVVAFVAYRRVLRRAKGIERGLKMVPLLIHLPPASADTAAEGRDNRDVYREKVAQAEVLYNLIAGTAKEGFKSRFYGQRHFGLEIIASGGLVHFYAAVPVVIVSAVEKAVLTAYPGAKIEEIEDYNIFNPASKLDGAVGGELFLKESSAYPIATFKHLERDPMEALVNSLGNLAEGEGAAIQILLRPASVAWSKASADLVKKKRHERHVGFKFTALDLIKATIKAPEPPKDHPEETQLSNLELAAIESIEEKTKHPGYEAMIRLVTSAQSHGRAEIILKDLVTAFALYDVPGLNGFKFYPAKDIQGLVTAFVFRFFPPEFNNLILNSVELATLFHLPDAQFTPVSAVERQPSKQVDGPVKLPPGGLLMGYNIFRGATKEIRLGLDDRRRHSYIVGQTGTGKSTLLENLAVQDMVAGKGFVFIDPHGDTAERLLGLVPKQRAEDVIYFNPADTEEPLGLNLFEFSSPEQKDFLIQEAIGMLYKLYDPGHTGIIGPRYEHWFRNAALTLMSDPKGATFIEIPKVFTDSAFLKQKFPHITDPTVIDFWTKEMAATSDYHKSEMLGWFVSKFGAFMTNTIMRNIIGQTKSAFNLREVMDQQKILIVNLSKGQIGELNAQLLGMMFVTKLQAAAMSRADVPEEQRSDFCLYVDEFQNFSTDSFATILSEARKYRLNLIVANQFIGQLTQQVKEAVFGNVGTIISYRSGPEDADFLVKQFAPTFEASDLVGLPNHHAVIRMMLGGLPSTPFSMRSLPPLGKAHPELATAVKQLSAAKYGASRAQVEAAILGRYASQPNSENKSSSPVETGKAPVQYDSIQGASPTSAPTVRPSAPVRSPVYDRVEAGKLVQNQTTMKTEEPKLQSTEQPKEDPAGSTNPVAKITRVSTNGLSYSNGGVVDSDKSNHGTLNISDIVKDKDTGQDSSEAQENHSQPSIAVDSTTASSIKSGGDPEKAQAGLQAKPVMPIAESTQTNQINQIPTVNNNVSQPRDPDEAAALEVIKQHEVVIEQPHISTYHHPEEDSHTPSQQAPATEVQVQQPPAPTPPPVQVPLTQPAPLPANTAPEPVVQPPPAPLPPANAAPKPTPEPVSPPPQTQPAISVPKPQFQPLATSAPAQPKPPPPARPVAPTASSQSIPKPRSVPHPPTSWSPPIRPVQTGIRNELRSPSPKAQVKPQTEVRPSQSKSAEPKFAPKASISQSPPGPKPGQPKQSEFKQRPAERAPGPVRKVETKLSEPSVSSKVPHVKAPEVKPESNTKPAEPSKPLEPVIPVEKPAGEQNAPGLSAGEVKVDASGNVIQA